MRSMILGEARVCSLKSRVSLRSASPPDGGVVKGDDMDFEDVAAFASLDDESLNQEMLRWLREEYDPERFVPPWMRERGDDADWEAWLRYMRVELHEQLKVAFLVGVVLEHLGNPWTMSPGYSWARDEVVRLQLFYGFAQELAKGGAVSDAEAGLQIQKHFTREENDRLSTIWDEACEAACRRALLIDGRPQASAS